MEQVRKLQLLESLVGRSAPSGAMELQRHTMQTIFGRRSARS